MENGLFLPLDMKCMKFNNMLSGTEAILSIPNVLANMILPTYDQGNDNHVKNYNLDISVFSCFLLRSSFVLFPFFYLLSPLWACRNSRSQVWTACVFVYACLSLCYFH